MTNETNETTATEPRILDGLDIGELTIHDLRTLEESQRVGQIVTWLAAHTTMTRDAITALHGRQLMGIKAQILVGAAVLSDGVLGWEIKPEGFTIGALEALDNAATIVDQVTWLAAHTTATEEEILRTPATRIIGLEQKVLRALREG